MEQATINDPVAVHDRYLPFRHDVVPFPPESVAFWCYLLWLQHHLGIRGNVLEIGVQHGGTAFLAAHALGEEERLNLVDIEKTSIFQDVASGLPREIADKINFHVGSSQDASAHAFAEMPHRFIHIDGDHTYDGVRADTATFARLQMSGAIVCFDDFFEIRWPDVTKAILDTYRECQIVPLVLCSRKAYFCRAEDRSRLGAAIADNTEVLERFGTVRVIDTVLDEYPVSAVRLAAVRGVAREPLRG